MLGNRRFRKATAVIGAGGLLLALGAFGPTADAEVVTIDGEAFGLDGLITVPPEVQGDPPEEVVIEPIPAVVLPDDGTDENGIEESEVLYSVPGHPGFVEVDIMSVYTQGSLSSSNQAGGVISDALLDNLDVLDGLITANEMQSSCLLDEGRSIAGVNFNELVINGDAIAEEPAPNTEIPIPDVGEVRLNVQEEVTGRIQVIAMELDFDIEDGASGSLRFGLAECGTEVQNVVDDQPVVPESQLADSFEGDPEFTG